MNIIVFISAFVELFFFCHGVPPSPADRLWEELDNSRAIMTNIATQLEKFNSLYLMKLEQKMGTMSTTLANIDSNIKNLQERAHVWDTFQLHVAAWNEQINTLDKKVEIISKGQEKMLLLDGKVNTIANIEYKIERIFGKQDDTLTFLQTLSKVMENQHHDPLLGEFTTRGVLSTLKIIERKLDKLQMQHSSSQSMLAKQIIDNKRKTDSDLEQKGKLLIKCNTPPKVEELLSDVASKVDVMFDKFASSHEIDYNNAEEQKDSSEIASQESKSDPDLKLIKGLLKRLNQPCKRTIKVLENLETSIKIIDNRTLTILEDEQVIRNDLINYYQSNDKQFQFVSSKTAYIFDKIEELFSSMNISLSNDHEFISSHFSEQREHFTRILQSELKKNIISKTPVITTSHDVEIYEYNISSVSTESAPYLLDSAIYTDRLNCEELDANDVSGLYVLGEDEDTNSDGRNYNTRYCHVAENEIWTVIQRRGDNSDVQNFNRSWDEYKNGFGSLDRDFWFGNDFIHALTTDKNLILRVELEDFEGHKAWAEYSLFKVLSESNKYKLLIGGYRGNASDSFSAHNNSAFSTFDRTNDDAPACCPCSPSYGGGWWFYSCFEANLNGVYYNTPKGNEYFRGLIWEHWLGNYSLRKTKMMVRTRTPVEHDVGSGTEPNIDSFDIPEDP